jgi:hypothetical protein
VSGALLAANNLSDVASAATALTNLGVTSTAAEINLIDGGTARGTTAIADGDGLLVNDAGTMRMTNVQTVKTYMTAGVGGGGTEFIASSGALSNAADVEFDQFDSSKYDSYIFKFYYLIPATDSVWPIGQVSSNGGTSYDTTNGNYHYGDNQDFNGYYLSPVYNMGSAANEYGMCGEMELFAPHLSIYTFADIRTLMVSTSGVLVDASAKKNQVHLVTAAQNAIKFSFSSGNIESGEIVMFGIKNS